MVDSENPVPIVKMNKRYISNIQYDCSDNSISYSNTPTAVVQFTATQPFMHLLKIHERSPAELSAELINIVQTHSSKYMNSMLILK